jgi:hypothetical protein
MAITLNVQTTFAHKGNEPGSAYFTLTCTAGTVYTTGGIPVDLTRATPAGVRTGAFISAMFVSSGGQVAVYVPGSSMANGTIKLFVSGAEVANATSLTGLVLTGMAVYGHGLNGIQTSGLVVG